MLHLKNKPNHIGIIMDGNGRWATQHKKKRTFGHTQAKTSIKETLQACFTYQIPILTLFAFSTENWKRPQDEINLLFELFKNYLNDNRSFFMENNICLKHIGKSENLPKDLYIIFKNCIDESKNNTGLQLNLAFDYGGKDEIIRTCKRIINKNLDTTEITEKTFSSYLDNPSAAQVDLIIRTSGEQRLSNFLLWQAAYAEIFFTSTLWPDFRSTDLEAALLFYDSIEKRLGGL